MKTSLVLTTANPLNNPRPKRIIEHLVRSDYACDVIGANRNQNGENLGINQYFNLVNKTRSTINSDLLYAFHALIIIVYNLLFIITRDDYYLSLIFKKKHRIPNPFKVSKQKTYNLVVCENLELLPFAVSLKKTNTTVIFDAREYYPKQFEDSFVFRLLERPINLHICSKYLSECDQVLTVSPGLATEYKREFGINPVLLRSTPVYHDVQVSKTNYNEIKLVHHGVANPNRKLENLIDIANKLDKRFRLDLYLSGKVEVIRRLKSLVKDSDKIRVLDHVPFDEIIPTLCNYDIGLSYFEPTTFNLKHALPNKFFEFIQARLAVLTGPSPDMKNLLSKYGCGFVSEQFSNQSVIELLDNLSAEQVDKAKRASEEAAKVLCWEEESRVLDTMFNTT